MSNSAFVYRAKSKTKQKDYKLKGRKLSRITLLNIKKDVFRLVTSVGQRKNSKSP